MFTYKKVSTPLLLLYLLNYPTLFYCHFPDLLLSAGRGGLKVGSASKYNWLDVKKCYFYLLVLIFSVNLRYTSKTSAFGCWPNTLVLSTMKIIILIIVEFVSLPLGPAGRVHNWSG